MNRRDFMKRAAMVVAFAQAPQWQARANPGPPTRAFVPPPVQPVIVNSETRWDMTQQAFRTITTATHPSIDQEFYTCFLHDSAEPTPAQDEETLHELRRYAESFVKPHLDNAHMLFGAEPSETP